MCGLFAVVLPQQYLSAVPVGFLVRRLGVLAEERGQDAAGLATCDRTGAWTVRRTLGPFRRLPRSSSGPRGANALGVAIGHTRWATQGGRTLAQASPIAARSLLCTHNGDLDPNSIPGVNELLNDDLATDSHYLFAAIADAHHRGRGLTRRLVSDSVQCSRSSGVGLD